MSSARLTPDADRSASELASAPPPGRALEEVVQALRTLRRVRTQGLRGGARGHVLAQLIREMGAPLVCVTSDEEEADRLASDLTFFLGRAGTLLEPVVLRLPADEMLPYDELSPDVEIVSSRLAALHHLRRGTPFPALVLSVRALARRVLPPEVMEGLARPLRPGDDVNRDTLARKLVEMGYHASPLVEDVGTFSVRGDIVDVFCPLYAKPVRLELFGDTLESVRTFDPETQRTAEPLQQVELIPARELLLSDATRPRLEATLRELGERLDLPSIQLRERLDALKEVAGGIGLEPVLPGLFEGGLASIFDYLPFWSGGERAEPIFYLDDPVGQDRNLGELWEELSGAYEQATSVRELVLPPEQHCLTAPQLAEKLTATRRLEGGGLSLVQADAPRVVFGFGTTQDLREAIAQHHGEEGALTPLVNRLTRWHELGLASVIACGSAGQVDRLKRMLLDREVSVRTHAELPHPPQSIHDPPVRVHLVRGEVSSGFVDPSQRLAVVADQELFGARARRKTRTRKAEQPFAAAFRDLKEGNLIVHSDFGIGRYQGLTQMVVQGVPGDFLVLEYAGKDKVYLPVSWMRLIQKFTGADPEHVTLDKLGSGSWEKTKKRVKEHLLKMAAELLRLYAARRAHPGHAFSAPDRYFRQFEADFEFEETPDQAKAIDDVLADMQKPEPMDRLVCGDVGYGKTEVALRAAFKAVQDHKQVAVLVPTTVLAQQHYRTFTKRFESYPVTLDVVSRMRKPEENREALRRAREGRLDILIGTHKLLASEVAFRDLGLLVVDEEQRFGVKQKEQIKRLKTLVDVLTLTATPIPRTLHMSMAGVRDLSIIATAPQDRRAIRTFVLKFDPGQIRDAIRREVQRGGQIFFIHNRVESMASIEQLLKELVPEVSFAVAHGQMKEGELEKVMLAFVERKYQLLLCTAIVESGIDIPSANTMIVNRADTFGLSQLYQLRGRVGRSKERAYAYLLVPSRRAVTREAQQRLEVLQTFTELGAGFSIASHDLEIRGAGNLLGPDQSGAIAAIGFDLYTQLLEEAVGEMRGEPPRVEIEPDVNLPLAALIPEDYVPDVHQRLVLYKRFSEASTPDELSDLRAELVDRYGELPDEVDHLTEVMLLKLELRDLRLRTLEGAPGRLVLTLGPDARLDPQKIAQRVQASGGKYRLTPDMKWLARLPEGAKDRAVLGEARKLMADVARTARM